MEIYEQIKKINDNIKDMNAKIKALNLLYRECIIDDNEIIMYIDKVLTISNRELYDIIHITNNN